MEKKKECKLIYILMGLIYFIALMPKAIQMLAIIFLTVYFLCKNRGKLYLDKTVILFFIVEIIQIISVIVYLLNHEFSERIIAAFNTISVWLCSCLIFSYLSKENIKYEKIERISFYNILIFVVLSVAMIFLKEKSSIHIGNRLLYGVDWLTDGKNYRLLAFMEYSNLIVMAIFMYLPFALNYIKKFKSRIIQIGFVIGSIIPIFLTNSRIGIVLSLIYLIIIFPSVVSFTKKEKKFFIFFGIIILLLGISMFYMQIYTKFNSIINSRKNSTSMRELIYTSSIQKTVTESVLIGIGVKEFIGNYPLGSHSTFIGMFYKTGILGLCVFIIGWIIIMKKVIKKHNLKYTLTYWNLLIIFCVEDLDGANWMIILFFILLSIFLNKKEEIK